IFALFQLLQFCPVEHLDGSRIGNHKLGAVRRKTEVIDLSGAARNVSVFCFGGQVKNRDGAAMQVSGRAPQTIRRHGSSDVTLEEWFGWMARAEQRVVRRLGQIQPAES